jgi:hypothetical protein
MVFDNGGSSGYGAPTPVSPDGSAIHQRAGSRVLEINPKTLELVWSYTGPRFFSTNISGAQRLPNGNTLITEGAPGRLLEVTSDRRIVWEYIYPVFAGANASNAVYRGYRSHDWIRQIHARPNVRVAARPWYPRPGTQANCSLVLAGGRHAPWPPHPGAKPSRD